MNQAERINYIAEVKALVNDNLQYVKTPITDEQGTIAYLCLLAPGVREKEPITFDAIVTAAVLAKQEGGRMKILEHAADEADGINELANILIRAGVSTSRQAIDIAIKRKGQKGLRLDILVAIVHEVFNGIGVKVGKILNKEFRK